MLISLLLTNLLCFFVISCRNPIFSLLSLVGTFILSGIVLLYLEVEFLALSFIILYVGAVAMFFLFIVILVDNKIADSSIIVIKHRLSFFIFITFFSFHITSPFLAGLLGDNTYHSFSGVDWFSDLHTLSNIEVIGRTLYTFHFFFVLIAGFVLLVSILGILMLLLPPSF